MVRRYIASSSTLLFGAMSQFVSFVLLARSLGIDQFGKLMAITAVTSLAMVLCGLGAGDSMIRRTARDPEQFSLMLGHGLILIAITGVPLAAISTLALHLFIHANGSAVTNIATFGLFSAANIVMYAFVSFVERAFLGHMDFRRANVVNAGFSLIRLLALVLAVTLFRIQTLQDWALTTFCAHLVASGIGWIMLRSLGRPIWQIDRSELRLGIHFSTPFVVDALRQNVDRIMLGIVAPISVLGSYGAATRIVTTSQLVINSLNRIMYPRLAQTAEQGIGPVIRLGVSYLCGASLVAVGTSAAVFVVAPLVPLVLGSTYQPIVFDLQILSWLVVPIAVQTIPYDIFGATDRHRTRATIYNSVTLTGTAGTAFLIYIWGVTGAFIGAYGVQIALAIAQWIAITIIARREQSSRALPPRLSLVGPSQHG